MDHQRIARLGAFDIKGAGHRVARCGDAVAGHILTAGIHGGGDHGVAGLDAQHRLVRTDGGEVVRGLKMVGGHSVLLVGWIGLG
jgi:hypothetical protein